MATSTFKALTLITDAEGLVANFKRGTFPRKLPEKDLPRALGGIIKDLGSSSAKHTFQLKFLNVASGNLATIRSRINNMHNPTTGRVTSGTLSIPNWQSFSAPHCTFTNCVETMCEERVDNVTPANPAGTVAYDLCFDCVFTQTRRG